jgi:two-component system, NtrC family, response regulator AtoC
MSYRPIDETFEAPGSGDEQQVAECGPEELHSLSQVLLKQLPEPLQSSSPARRTAACQSDITLMERSHAFVEVLEQVGRVSNTNLPVLLTGEPGTGKELIASAIHHRSDRADKPFLAVNCGTTPEESVERELSGDGTVFLNEITQTSPSFQTMLLRALETGEIHRAGSNETTKLNARVIATSSRNLEQAVAAGTFRNDLFYRLNSVSIVLPPLRARREDIPSLAQSFADRVYSFSAPVKFSDEALALLERYNWPGNVRELENAVVRAVAMCDGTIRVKDLPERVRNYTQNQSADVSAEATTNNGHAHEEWVPLSAIEGRYVAQVLEHTRGNKQAAARVLAVDRKTLDRMIKRHHIDPERARRAGG